MSSAHAILGASSSHRWMECPGSIALSAGMPNESSVYAREGSAAHAVAARCLEEGLEALDLLGWEVPDYEDIEVEEDMCGAVQEYLDAVRADIKEYTDAGYDDYEMGVEVRFDLTHIYKDMFGTCDCTIYYPGWKRLSVFDYKHGWVAVSAENNPQTLYYGVGALTGKHNRAIETIELVIVQPRSGQNAIVKRWECDAITLMDFIADLVAAAKRTEERDAPLKPGEWCKYCPAAVKCQSLVDLIIEVVMATMNVDDTVILKEPSAVPLDKLKIAWDNAIIIEGWVKSVKGYAHSEALKGNLLPGTKLVEGRSRREWIDPIEAKKTLKALVAIGDIEGDIEEVKLKSPSKIETLLGKKNVSAIKRLWKRGKTGLSLVPIADERPVAKVEAESEFE